MKSESRIMTVCNECCELLNHKIIISEKTGSIEIRIESCSSCKKEAIEVITTLLDCPDLNYDEIDDYSEDAIKKAYNYLEMYRKTISVVDESIKTDKRLLSAKKQHIQSIFEIENLTFKKVVKLIDDGILNDYIDRTDVSIEISLFEYGLIRNPKTNECIVYPNANSEFPEDNEIVKFQSKEITFEDVKEHLNEIEIGFFSFIGSDKEKELNELDNNNLSYMINSINQYDGYFINW